MQTNLDDVSLRHRLGTEAAALGTAALAALLVLHQCGEERGVSQDGLLLQLLRRVLFQALAERAQERLHRLQTATNGVNTAHKRQQGRTRTFDRGRASRLEPKHASTVLPSTSAE